MVILVLLRVEGPSGSATLVCNEIAQDPLFSDKVLLRGVQGLSWPVGPQWVNVQDWSVKKEDVLNWMAGPLQEHASLTMEMMEGQNAPTPWPPGTLPNMPLNNDQPEIDALIKKKAPQEPTSAPKGESKPDPKRAARSKSKD